MESTDGRLPRLHALARICAALMLVAPSCAEEVAPAQPEPEVRRAPPANVPAAFDCGELEPGLDLACGDATVELTDTFAPDEDRGVIQLGPLECEPLFSSVGESLSAWIDAWCDDEAAPSGAGFTRAMHLRASAKSVCSIEGGTSAFVAPRWRSTISVPSGRYRVSVSSASNRDGDARCVVRLAGQDGDSIRIGRSRLHLAFVDGPTDLEVELDCRDGLASSNCEKGSGGAPVAIERLDLFIDVVAAE